MRSLVDRLWAMRRLGTATCRTDFAILLLQNLAALPILFLVGAFAAQSHGSALIAVAVIQVIGRLVIRPVFRLVGMRRSGVPMVLRGWPGIIG